MPIAEFISALGERLDIPDLKLQQNGTASVQIPDQFSVTVEQLDDADQCLIYAFIERIPAASETAVYAQLLHANLFGAETSDATLSIDPQSGRVVVHRKLSLAALSQEDFFESWLRLVGVASHWNQRLSGGFDDGDTTPAMNSERPALGQWLSV